MSLPEPTKLQLEGALQIAVERLRDEDRELQGTTERVVVARLMICLNKELRHLPNPRGFRLDMEYERAGTNSKAFAGRGPNGDFHRKIVPDLIYHQRLARDKYANHLAIEVKARPGGKEDHDLAKLGLLTGRTQYVFAPFTPRVLRLRSPCDPQEPPRDRHVVVLPPGIRPYAFGALLRLYHREEFIEWV